MSTLYLLLSKEILLNLPYLKNQIIWGICFVESNVHAETNSKFQRREDTKVTAIMNEYIFNTSIVEEKGFS